MPFCNLKHMQDVSIVSWWSYQGDATSSNCCLRLMGQDPDAFALQTGIHVGDKVEWQIVPGHVMLHKLKNPPKGKKRGAAMMVDNGDGTFRFNNAFGRHLNDNIIRPLFSNRNARYDMPKISAWRAPDGDWYIFIELPSTGRFAKLHAYSLDQPAPVFRRRTTNLAAA